MQVSVYLVGNCKRIRTMLFPGRGDFVSCCFSGDSKWLATVGSYLDSNIVVWNWDKEKASAVETQTTGREWGLDKTEKRSEWQGGEGQGR